MEDEKRHLVVCEPWLESERGWGVRPGGYTLHLCEHDRRAYIKEYWDSMPDAVPAWYMRPTDSPYTCVIDEDFYQKLVASTNGIRGPGEDFYLPPRHDKCAHEKEGRGT